MKIAFKTFGCKVNQYDTQALRKQAEDLGFETVPARQPWDLLVVNTCAVTERAQVKAMRYVRKALARGEVVVFGCGTRTPANRADPWGDAAVVSRAEAVLDLLTARTGASSEPGWTGAGIVRFQGQARAFLKMGDGCPGGCSYCIIPALRGPLASRDPDVVMAEARTLSASHGEIVLTAIHLGLYGTDLDPPASLAGVLKALLEDEAVTARLRLSSLESGEVTDPLLSLLPHPGLAPHLHLPLQSGDRTVLERMGRPYGPDEFMAVVDRVRGALPDPALTTDIITGFPGEDDAAFEATLNLVKRLAFSRLHVFPWSPRPGTPAAELPGRLPQRVVSERTARLIEAGRLTARDFRARRLGRTLKVLAERPSPHHPGMLEGHSGEYLLVRFPGSAGLLGTLVPVKITGEDGEGLVGEIRGAGCRVQEAGGESSKVNCQRSNG